MRDRDIMGKMEKLYRVLFLGEELLRIRDRAAELQARMNGNRADLMQSAVWHMRRAEDIIKAVATGDDAESIETVLEVSIDGVRRRRREELKA